MKSRAKSVSVLPFWWNAIQKKITTANTRQRHTMRSFVSAGESSFTSLAGVFSSFFFVSEASTCLYVKLKI